MSHTCKVSIVLPTYNGSRYLEQAIRSCQEQTFSDWELILVDDYSTDATPEIISRYVKRDPRICAIRHAENRRLPGALNTGFAKARGEYLTWTSDDNLYRPSAIAVMAGHLDKTPEVSLVYADYTTIDANGCDLFEQVVGDAEDLAERNVVGACFLYRRAVYEALGNYSETLCLAEDYDYWMRAFLHFRLQPVRQDLYQYRLHEASLTYQFAERVREVTGQTIRAHLPRISQKSRILAARSHLALCEISLSQSEIGEARSHLTCALRASPGLVLRTRRLLLANVLFGRHRGNRIYSAYMKLRYGR